MKKKQQELTVSQAKGNTIRLVDLLIITEIEWDCSKKEEKRRLMWALTKQLKEKVQEYFRSFPAQAPGIQNPEPNRYGFFLRRVQRYLMASSHYFWNGRSKEALAELRTILDEVSDNITAFYLQYPEERPEYLTTKLPLDGSSNNHLSKAA